MSVVVTGLGAITAIGSDVPAFWSRLLAGEIGARPAEGIDVSGLSTRVACEVRSNGEPVPRGAARAGRATALLLAALREAIADADLADLERAGICVGTTLGEVGAIEAAVADGRGPGDWGLAEGHDRIARVIAEGLGLRGPRWTLSNACAAGNYAIVRAVECIRRGDAPVMLAGGVDALSQVAFTGFHALRIMARERCRPFDRNREGLLLGEGAGAVVLEDGDRARRRGATVYAEVLGYGLSCDAHHIAQPDTCGAGAAAAMRRALRDARISTDAVDYISAHGTGTRNNDRAEALAVLEVFGDRGTRIPMSSIKAQIGHTLGGATAIEAAVCCLALRDGVAPATCTFEEPDPECPVDAVPASPRLMGIDIVLNNGYAFGGNNSTLLLARPGRG